MFYSHEILTSQEHGVATIWLVATLGPRSTSKKVNRKAILDVDVPKACDTIMNPEVPMALRLQGNLLYGVSRVYNRQCVYALTDVQSMLDRMKIALKVVHGRGLDPQAGKASPEELIVPYDPAFIPELSLPGLNLDLVNLYTATESRLSLHSSLLSSNVSSSDHSRAGIDAFPQLDISSPSIVLGDNGGFTTLASDKGSTQRDNYGLRDLALEDEEGVLLQPDFEFDEEGNIVDLSPNELPLDRSAQQHNLQTSEPTVRGQVSADVEGGIIARHQQHGEPMDLDPEIDHIMGDDANGLPRERRSPRWGRLPDPEYLEGVEETSETRNAALSRKKRVSKIVKEDEHSQISRAELIRWDEEYLHNMSLASKQKGYHRELMQAKKNAFFWMVGRGIGSVGVGIGVSRISHPLQCFSGEQLLEALSEDDVLGRKRSLSVDDDDVSSDKGRRVRPRIDDGEIEPDLPRGDQLALGDADVLMQEEVEIGRHAPPSLQDDASSQMPWNITASILGSIQGSASSLPRHFESQELPARRQLGGFGRPGRLTSSSPLAGRGLTIDPVGHDRLSSLSLTGDDFDILDSFDMEAYLGDERDMGRADAFNGFEHGSDVDVQGAAEAGEMLASLSQGDRNFLEFVKSRIKSEKAPVTTNNVPTTQSSEPKKEISFSMLLPPENSSRAVATQGLMHVLALATQNILAVHQDNGDADVVDENEVNNYYGEIHLSIREQYF